MTRNTAAVGAILALCTHVAFAQSSPSGPEFRVNTATTGDQASPSVSVDPVSGRFVVLWQEAGSCEAQRYDASGLPLGGRFTALGVCSTPGSGAALTTGEFVVFGPSNHATTGYVYGNAFFANGSHKGYLVIANTYTTGAKSAVRFAADPTGNFVVVWSAAGEDGNGYGVFAHRYLSSDASEGSEFRVNTITTGDQKLPAAARDGSGNFLVVWQSGPIGAARCCTQIEAQRFDPSGNALGGEFRVNTYSGLDNFFPDVAADSSGNFVIAWTSFPYGYSSQVLAERLSADGSPVGDPFLVNASTTIGASHPRVTRRNGDFVIVWQESSDGSGLAALGRRYAPDGSTLGPIFRVNTHTTGDQVLPAVSSKPDGGFVVAWESDGQDGSGKGIYAQKYCLGGDADGNGTVDVADAFYLINYLYAGGPPPRGCANGDGSSAVDIADVFYLINYLFAGGPPPV
jgi:hypothetical protein